MLSSIWILYQLPVSLSFKNSYVSPGLILVMIAVAVLAPSRTFRNPVSVSVTVSMFLGDGSGSSMSFAVSSVVFSAGFASSGGASWGTS